MTEAHERPDEREPAGLPRPEIVVRGRAGRWVRRLVVAGVLVVAGAAALLAELVPEGIPRVVVSLFVLGAFGFGAAAVAAITLRWRTSVRCDGGALVVPISPDLDPVALEAFACRVGIPVVDLDDAPGFRPL